MSDLISRVDAINYPVMPKKYRRYETLNLDDAYEQGWTDLQSVLERMPTVDPVKHGKWIRDAVNFSKYYCSECGFIYIPKWNYCPHCGARMDEVEELR